MAAEGSGTRGFFLDVALSAVEPGVNNSVLLFMNIVFVLLLCSLVAITFVVGLNVHLIILGILAFGLMLAFNFFISQLPSSTDSQQCMSPDRTDQQPTGDDKPKKE